MKLQAITNRERREQKTLTQHGRMMTYTHKFWYAVTLTCGHTRRYSECNCPKFKALCKECPT
jgi:hypothetical protein